MFKIVLFIIGLYIWTEVVDISARISMFSDQNSFEKYITTNKEYVRFVKEYMTGGVKYLAIYVDFKMNIMRKMGNTTRFKTS